MSTKKEIYYKFIFPNYDSLSGSDSDSFPTMDGSDSNSFPTWDGDGQEGEVRALCRICPGRVITYDQLTATNPKPMYANGTNGWSVDKKTAIKNYIDKYLKIPKYFDLRNYEDTVSTQRLGMSLMVSDSPEVGGDYSHYTKFDFDGKTIYCAVMISSGDFFYNFCLPDEVIEKSGLADEVVKPVQYKGASGGKTPLLRFHSNWCFNITERGQFMSALNVQTGQEKRIFVQHYFEDNFNYGAQNKKNTFYYFNFISDSTGTTYSPTDSNLHCKDILGKYTDELGVEYTGSNKNFPLDEYVDHYYINDDIPANRVTRHTYTSHVANSIAWKGIEHSSNYNEDLKRDFIALEVTRRILYYYNGEQLMYNNVVRDIHPTSDIPRIIGNATGKDTVLSYEPPAEYINKEYYYYYNNYSKTDILSVRAMGTPPLQIPYNLLRYALNDKPPVTDCETVLVIWVATHYYDSNHNLVTPDNISDSDPDKVKKLHDLGWEQYAIPISCRCCFNNKNDRDNGSKHIHNRFLIDYPNKWDYYYTYNGDTTNPANTVFNIAASDLTYRFHTRRAEMYDSNDTNEDTKFKEVLYLQDLIRYSNDYIIAYQNTAYYNKGFDIQGYLFKNYSSDFAKLYVSKTFVKPSLNDGHTISNATGISMNQQGQFYYIRVNKTDSQGNNVFDINTNGYSSSNRRICICEPNTTNVFKPSDRIYRLNIENEKWVYNASNFIEPTTKVSILGEVKDFGFDDMSYHQEYGYNDWFIYDSYLIALFKKPSSITTLTKQLTLTGHTSLYNDLGGWENLYISSLGVTQYNPVLVDAVLLGGGQTTIYPLGILDNHIQLDGTTYGSTANNKIVVGFANMLDYLQEDLYHFKFINNEYRPVKTALLDYSGSSPGPVDTPTSYTCTAYVMNYSQS